MGLLETYGLYSAAFLVFVFAWKEASAAMRAAQAMKNERQIDVARADRKFAVFAGVYVAFVVFLAARFTPKPRPEVRPPPTPAPTRVQIGKGKAIKAKALIFDGNGKLSVEDDKGKLHRIQGKARIELPGG